MIKIWTYKNRNRTGTAVFIKKPTETDRKSENGNRHSTTENEKKELWVQYTQQFL